ncbi:adenosylcobinamide-GDP ribazoletransferase [Cohnella cellulosilytica]|uniref:Adenosylcobinamide-GDP ribazoletransferase n=1 Tax=Cohnella cellulosilytica TaxID=986710 RepID=A0ABW2F2W7_9BACL
MNAFWQAVGFLTRFPVPKRAHTLEGWNDSPKYYPLVGLLLGAVIWLAARLAELGFGSAASPVAAALVVAFWIYATGALHLDGWMDLADGLGSQRSRERTLEIMKDSRVGAMGVVAAIVLILLKVAAVQQLAAAGALLALTVVPAMARAALLGAIRFFPYIQREGGLGSGLRGGVTPAALLVNGLLVLAASFAAGRWMGVIAFAAILLAGGLFGRSIVRRLGGFTGDVYGALIEGAETLALLVLLILNTEGRL